MITKKKLTTIFSGGVKFAQEHKIQNCTKILLKEGTKLHNNKIARRINFTRKHFCTG